jgi:hypothetical protein
MRLDMSDIGLFAGTVDDEEQIFAAVDEHQVVENSALFIEQQAVALLVQAQVHDIDGHQRFERGGGIGAAQQQLAHVRDIEQAGGLARVQMLGHQALRVLHGHGVAGKRHHAAHPVSGAVQTAVWNADRKRCRQQSQASAPVVKPK